MASIQCRFPSLRLRFSTIFPGRRTLKTISIIGCGDIGQRVATLWLHKGMAVHALSRTPEQRPELKASGIALHSGDLDRPGNHSTIPTQDALLYYFAPPPGNGEDDPRMRHFLDTIPTTQLPVRVVYISTSGVYGDCQGALVTEQTPPQPATQRARRRLAAEATLLRWGAQHNVAITILRVGGIYGPGRLPLARIRQQAPLLLRSEAPFSNRIHADDLARICLLAGQHRGPSTLYNTCDGEHSTMTDYFLAVAAAAAMPPPPQVSWREAKQLLSPAMLSYLTESRRLDNSKLVQALEYEFLYPNLKAGLPSCFT